VYRNGVRLVSTDYTATTGTTVVLANACTSGDAVVTESFLVSSVLNAIPATAGAVNSTYLTDASVTQAKLGTGVAGNGPAFGATLSTSQTFTANTWTKVQFNSEDFDTNTCYDPSTNYRFTPNVAGYYQINTWISFDSSGTNPVSVGAKIYKNGSYYRIGNFQAATPNSSVMVGGSGIVYANGSTDYFETYGYMNGGSGTISVFPTGSYFSAALVRSA